MDKQTIIIRKDTRAKNKSYLSQQIGNLSHDKDWQVEIKEYKKNRSLAQNGLLWMWMEYISKKHQENTGILFTKKQWKIDLQDLLLPIICEELPSGIKERKKGTSELNTKEFTDFLEAIDFYISEYYKIHVPYPEHIYYEAMGKDKGV